MDEITLNNAKSSLWQAYTLLHFLTKTSPDAEDLSDIITALLGVKTLMFNGLEELEELEVANVR